MASSPKPTPPKQFNPAPEPKYKMTPEEKEGMVKKYAKGGPVKPDKAGGKALPPWLKKDAPKAPGMKAGGMKKGC